MADRRPASRRGPSAWRRRTRGGPSQHLLGLVLAGLLAAWAWQRHMAWARADRSLPVGDAPGHVLIAMRWWRWLVELAPQPPNEPFPPLVYLSLAWARLHGPASFDQLHLAMAGWSALLVGAAAWAAARGGGGLAGALLAGTLALAAPHSHWVAHQFLLDIPATAAVLLTLGAAWWSRGFRRPLPALLAGLGLGLVVLTKFSLLIWLLAPALLWLAALALRAPLGLVPVALFGLSLAWWAQRLWAMRGVRVLPTLPPALLWNTGGLLLGLLAAAVILRALARRPAARALSRGLGATVAAQAALTTSLLWLWWGVPAAWEKIEREALVEVREAGWSAALDMVLTQLGDGVPLAGWLLLLAGLATLWGRGRRAGVEVLLAVAGGTWLLSRTLPLDVKYYAPVVPLVAVGLGASLGGWRRTRPVAAIAGLCLALVLALPQDLLPTAPVSARAQGGARLLRPRLVRPVAPAPVIDDWEGAVRAVVEHAVPTWQASSATDCRGYALAVPSLTVIEDRAVVASSALMGVQEELWARPSPDTAPCGGVAVIATGELPPGLVTNPDLRWPEAPTEPVDLLVEARPTTWARVMAWQRPGR